MRRTVTAVLSAALLAGGLAVTVAPAAQAGVIICKPAELRQQAAQLDRKAEELKHLGERAAAAKAHQQADALRKKAQMCEDADGRAS
ncbi:hypothetical protein [Streptomyces melanogenes]|uniref:Secreted protein n=1 Tax=Streptomyces melanogenes TaxID=67326 RepID=A0ABZ1XK72_9ACTN|nr:hypothetical protein [Streptomyces melanogenes]